ncbi:MAG: hypothetical protein RI967_26 [Planctomycetota bacterium]
MHDEIPLHGSHDDGRRHADGGATPIDRRANRSARRIRTTAGALIAGGSLLLLSPGVVGAAHAGALLSGAADARANAAASPLDTSARREANALSRAFRSAARALSPSVVTINTVSSARAAAQGAPTAPFPGFPGMPGPGVPRGAPQPARGTGTGVVISADGHIVTANHVVEDADRIEIVLADGRTADAEIVGLDPGTDIAVLRTKATGLAPARFGDSGELEAGDWVVAVGAPFGLEQTVTAGIVSAKGRSDVGLATFENYIQTDAAINPGNSGGPLANLDGEIVGINAAISSRGGGNDGIGFAVPSAVVRRVVDSLIADGRVARGYLGVAVQPIDAALAASLGAGESGGIVVNEVVAGSPAADAGLEPGDVIVSIGDRRVRTPGELVATIGAAAPGDEIGLEVLRGGDARAMRATLSERRDGAAARSTRPAAARPSALAPLGLAVEELSPRDAAALGLGGGDAEDDAAEDGALVIGRVEEGSPAARAGLSAGDAIRRVGRQPVHTLDELLAAIEALGEDASVPLLVEREGRARFVLVRTASAESPAPRARGR